MVSVYVGKCDCMKDCAKIQKQLDDYGIKGYIFHISDKYRLKTYSYPTKERAQPFADLLSMKGFPNVEVL